jgi:hypothetical protein
MSGSLFQYREQCPRLDQRELLHHLCHLQNQRQCPNQGKLKTQLLDWELHQSETHSQHQWLDQHRRLGDQARSQRRDVSLNLLLLLHRSRLLQPLLSMNQTPSLCCRPILEMLLVNPVFLRTVQVTNPNNVNEPQSHQGLSHLVCNKR